MFLVTCAFKEGYSSEVLPSVPATVHPPFRRATLVPWKLLKPVLIAGMRIVLPTPS